MSDHLLHGHSDSCRGGSMSAYMDGPWKCGSFGCRGRLADCKAAKRNRAEHEWLRIRTRDDAWENAWREALGLPVRVLTIRDARSAVR